ncbi:MAG: hypothetical protein V8Q36_03205 [Anaerotignum sp.]
MKGVAQFFAYLRQCPFAAPFAAGSGRGTVSHAYLLTGSSGSGKRLIADTFAKTLQCEAGGTEPCGHCRSCSAFDSGNHPDIVYVRPAKKTLGVDDVREQILEDVSLKQYRYRYKIYIVEQADTMTVQAQNALLKTLEEPPAYAVFLLLAENQTAFLPPYCPVRFCFISDLCRIPWWQIIWKRKRTFLGRERRLCRLCPGKHWTGAGFAGGRKFSADAAGNFGKTHSFAPGEKRGGLSVGKGFGKI